MNLEFLNINRTDSRITLTRLSHYSNVNAYIVNEQLQAISTFINILKNVECLNYAIRINTYRYQRIHMRSSIVVLKDGRKDDIVTLDDILLFIGEFGYYQRYLFVMLIPFALFYSAVYFVQVFITVTPEEYWCKLPDYKNMSVDHLRNLFIPKIDKVPYEGHTLPYSRCWIYDVSIDKIMNTENVEKNWPVKKCNKWDFNYTAKSVPYSTISSEQGWVCDRNYFVNLAQSIFFVGGICGGFLFGWIADKYGRIPVLISTGLLGFIGGIGTIFAKTFWHFCICRFIVGFAFDNIFVVAYILVLEFVGPKWRTFVANMSYGVFFTLGLMILPWMAYYIANWRLFTLVTTVPLISVVFTPWLIPESVRWLITQGKIEKAVEILTYVEKFNKSTVPQLIYEDFLDECIKTVETLDHEDHNIWDLFKTPRLRTITLILISSWAIMAMVYDGHIRCLDSLGLEIFTTFTIGAATEFPAVILVIFTLDICGRRWSLFGSVVLSGFAAFGAASVPIGIYFASFAMIGRFFMNIAINIGLQYAAELLPTVVRGEGVAFIHIIGFVSSILSPFVAYTNIIQYNLPMIILGTLSIIACILCLFLPETLKEELPQTILDGELFGIDQRFWDNPIKKRFKETPPCQHFLHAQRPVSRGAILRSSMVSGYTGNEPRLKILKQNIEHARVISRKKIALAKATSSAEYVRLLREGYSDARNEKLIGIQQAKEEEQKGEDDNEEQEKREEEQSKKKKKKVRTQFEDDEKQI